MINLNRICKQCAKDFQAKARHQIYCCRRCCRDHEKIARRSVAKAAREAVGDRCYHCGAETGHYVEAADGTASPCCQRCMSIHPRVLGSGERARY